LIATSAERIAVILSGGAFLFCVMWIAAYPVFFLAFLFVLFSLAWRTASTMYIDVAGPVMSSQTLRHIGPEMVTPLHALAYFLTVMPFFLLIRPHAIERWKDDADRDAFTLSDAMFALSTLLSALPVCRHDPQRINPAVCPHRAFRLNGAAWRRRAPLADSIWQLPRILVGSHVPDRTDAQPACRVPLPRLANRAPLLSALYR
jgi:hypothetical protein